MTWVFGVGTIYGNLVKSAFYSPVVLRSRYLRYKRRDFNKPAVIIFSLLLFSAGSMGVFADVKLPAVISNNMVLQQKTEVPIWGWAEPDEQVSIKGSWQLSAVSTKTGREGKWMVKIGTPKAGGPFEITIQAKNKIVLRDVLAGEVWICSGQSNMAWSVRRSNNAEEETAAARYPDIRLFTVKRKATVNPQADCEGEWVKCSEETIADFSAVAYFFGRKLHKELNVPVGLIHTSWGGSNAEAWVRKEVLESDADFAPILQRYADDVANYPKSKKEYEEKMKEWEKQAAGAKSLDKKAPKKPRLAVISAQQRPSQLYNAMLKPLIGYGIKGVVWYQGESNVARAYQYRKLFVAMIKNWREDWGQGDFPFYYVQIAPYLYKGKEGSAAAELREAQLMALSEANVGMAVTMDIGETMNIHPKNKQDVGRRLALWAMAKTYGRREIVCSGPIYKTMKVEGAKIRLFFDYVGGGLTAKAGELTHFTIAGKDKGFVPAKAEIDGDTILVSSDQVKNPAAVRFGWSNPAVPNLFNKEGLPASSFRTDDRPGVTVDKR